MECALNRRRSFSAKRLTRYKLNCSTFPGIPVTLWKDAPRWCTFDDGPCTVMDNLIGSRKSCAEATEARYLRSSSTIRLATSRYVSDQVCLPLKRRSDTLQSTLVTYTSIAQGQGTYAPDHMELQLQGEAHHHHIMK